MARKSRSKQRSKGAGTRSGSAGGKSQGGGRSSAGKGKSQGGSGKSGGGKSGGSKSGGSSKGPGGGKSPSSRTKKTSPPAKSPAPRSRPTLTGPGMGPRGKLSTPQSIANRARFKAREAAGLSGLTGGQKGDKSKGTTTLGNYRAAQRESVVNNALGRQATFQTGIPSGSNLPAGSFGISEAGRAQAEANRKAAQEAAKKEATRKSMFDPNRALNYAKGFNTLSIANMVAPEGGLSSYYMKGAKPNLTFGEAMRLENSMQQQTGKFDPNKKFNLASYARAESNPFRGMPGYGTIKSLVNPRIRNINYNRMLQGKPNLSMDKINPGGFQTAPTEGFRRLAPALGAFMPGFSIGSKLFNEGRTDSALTKSLSNVDNVNVGGLSIGFNSPESTDVGARVGRFFTSLPGRISDAFTGGDDTKVASAGGLNIGGGVDSGETEGSGTGRTLTARFNKPGFDTLAGGLDFATNDRFDFDNLGKGLFGYGAVTPSNVINDAMSIAQNKNLTVKDMGTFLNTVKDISTSDDKLGTVKNILSNQDTTSRLLGPVYNQLRDSEIVDSLATKKLGLPDNYGEQLDQTKGALETAYNKLGTDDKANRRIISDLFIGKDPNLNLLKRGAEQFTNQSGTIANYQDKTNLAKFQDSFKENSPLFKGLNKDERGMIGSLGNWRLSNLGTKIVGSNLEGTNNVADLASNIIDTAGTNKATQSFLKTIGVKGAPTPKTIIEGAIPKFGNRSSDSNAINRLRSSVGSSATTLAGATPTSVEQILPLPTTATQTGTNSGNLGGIMQNAYQNQMSLYGMNPNYFANIMQPRFNRPMKRFRQVFNRGYF